MHIRCCVMLSDAVCVSKKVDIHRWPPREQIRSRHLHKHDRWCTGQFPRSAQLTANRSRHCASWQLSSSMASQRTSVPGWHHSPRGRAGRSQTFLSPYGALQPLKQRWRNKETMCLLRISNWTTKNQRETHQKSVWWQKHHQSLQEVRPTNL